MFKRIFNGIQRGWKLFRQSVRVFCDYPKLFVPILVCWLVYAPTVLFLELGLNVKKYTLGQNLLIIFGVIFLFAFLLTFSASVLLELIEQHEASESMDLSRAFKYTVTKNSYRLLPIIIAWTIVWFILLLVEAVFSSNESKDFEDRKLTVSNAAETLSGSGDMSLLSLISSGLRKGLRMFVFLILPAVAWEEKNAWQATKRGFAVLKSNPSTFATGFALTFMVAIFMSVPSSIILEIQNELDVVLPDWVWVTTILYMAFTWSYLMYLEQMFTAGLFLWHKNWEQAVKSAKEDGRQPPTMDEVDRPSILNDQSSLAVFGELSQSGEN
jgi:hypothetical protein